jgi:hypothetical protein
VILNSIARIMFITCPVGTHIYLWLKHYLHIDLRVHIHSILSYECFESILNRGGLRFSLEVNMNPATKDSGQI